MSDRVIPNRPPRPPTPPWVDNTDPSGQIRPPAAAGAAESSQPREVQASGSAVDEVIPIVYGGKLRVGALIYYVNNIGGALWVVGIICEGEVQSITDVSVNDQPAPAGSVMSVHLGTPTQALDPALSATDPNWNEALENTAYVVMQFTTAMALQGFPKITVGVEGRKLLDPRTGTIGYSDNPALCLDDLMRTYGGLTVDANTTKHAADYCDSRGFRLALALSEKRDVMQYIDILRQYVPALVSEVEGSYFILPDEPTPSTHHYGEDDIEANPPPKLVRRGYRDLPNIVEVEWADASKVPTVTQIATYGTATTDIRKTRLQLPGINTQGHAEKIAALRWKHYKIETIEGEICVFDESITVVPGDVITITERAFKWDRQPVRVIAVQERANGRYLIRFRIYDDSIYADEPPTGVGDPNFRNVVLLLHGEGADGAQGFVDSSSYRQRLQSATNDPVGGTILHSTADKQWGTSSLKFAPGTGTGLMVWDNRGVFNLGAAWTIEFWAKPLKYVNGGGTMLTAAAAIWIKTAVFANDSIVIQWDTSGAMHLQSPLHMGGTPPVYDVNTPGPVIRLNVWQHVAVSFDGTNVYLFVDGVLQAPTPTPFYAQAGGTSPVIEMGRGVDGFIDDVRITRYVCRYTASFTPPTAAFPP